jgi:hypothetical protein
LSSVYWFIATKTTYASTIPLTNTTVPELARRVRGALLANSQPMRAGQLFQFSNAKARPNLLLCDGSELPKDTFQDLYAEIGDDEGAASVPENFKIPNFQGAAAPAATYPTQTVTGSDSNTGGMAVGPTQPGQTGGTTGYNPPSGGRPNRQLD